MRNKKTISTVIGIAAIATNLMAITYKAMLGMRAGWESLMMIIFAGLVLSIISIIVKRSTVSWISVASTLVAIGIFFAPI